MHKLNVREDCLRYFEIVDQVTNKYYQWLHEHWNVEHLLLFGLSVDEEIINEDECYDNSRSIEANYVSTIKLNDHNIDCKYNEGQK